MGRIKGQTEYNKWVKKERLTRKEAILANCYQCNGLNESAADCRARGCPLYGFHPYRST